MQRPTFTRAKRASGSAAPDSWVEVSDSRFHTVSCAVSPVNTGAHDQTGLFPVETSGFVYFLRVLAEH